MVRLQYFLQRRRKALIRYGTVAAIGLVAVAVALPRAGAHDPDRVAAVRISDELAVLLSPERLSDKHFATLYGVPQS